MRIDQKQDYLSLGKRSKLIKLRENLMELTFRSLFSTVYDFRIISIATVM